MGRILTALKQIEARQARGAPPTPRPPEPPEADETAAAPRCAGGPELGDAAFSGPLRDTNPEAAPGDTLLAPAQDPGDALPGAPPELPAPPPDGADADLHDAIRGLAERRESGQDPGYCQMAANILAQLPAGRPAVLLFAGVADGGAATRTLAPLAAVLGETLPRPVLAVDARPDGPELAGCFGVESRRSLIEVLGGDARWQEAVRATPVSNLHVLPGSQWDQAKQRPPSGALAELFEQLRRQYRLVLVDGGALDGAAADGLAVLCDGVYLVVHLGRTPRRAVLAAVDDVRRAGARVLGCIAAAD